MTRALCALVVHVSDYDEEFTSGISTGAVSDGKVAIGHLLNTLAPLVDRLVLLKDADATRGNIVTNLTRFGETDCDLLFVFSGMTLRGLLAPYDAYDQQIEQTCLSDKDIFAAFFDSGNSGRLIIVADTDASQKTFCLPVTFSFGGIVHDDVSFRWEQRDVVALLNDRGPCPAFVNSFADAIQSSSLQTPSSDTNYGLWVNTHLRMLQNMKRHQHPHVKGSHVLGTSKRHLLFQRHILR